MKVDHPVVIFMDQEVRDDKEETRQNDEVDRIFLHQRQDNILPVQVRLWKHTCRNAEPFGFLKGRDSGLVRNDKGDIHLI